MIQVILVILLILWSQNTVIGYKTVYSNEPVEREFDSLDDAMDYAELRRTGWRGSIEDFYKLKDDDTMA